MTNQKPKPYFVSKTTLDVVATNFFEQNKKLTNKELATNYLDNSASKVYREGVCYIYEAFMGSMGEPNFSLLAAFEQIFAEIRSRNENKQ